MRVPYVRKSKREYRVKFTRESRRSQEAFVVIVMVVLVLLVIAVLVTIWYMPTGEREERGVTTVSGRALDPLADHCGQAQCDRRALTGPAVQLDGAVVLVLDDSPT